MRTRQMIQDDLAIVINNRQLIIEQSVQAERAVGNAATTHQIILATIKASRAVDDKISSLRAALRGFDDE